MPPSQLLLAQTRPRPGHHLLLSLLQVLHGNTACPHVVPFGDWSFTDSASCQARKRLPLAVFHSFDGDRARLDEPWQFVDLRLTVREEVAPRGTNRLWGGKNSRKVSFVQLRAQRASTSRRRARSS